MTTCSHTGITVPECSCQACVKRLIEQHMPAAVVSPAAAVEPAGTEVSAALPRVDLPATAIAEAAGARGMLRRLRRSRLRKTA